MFSLIAVQLWDMFCFLTINGIFKILWVYSKCFVGNWEQDGLAGGQDLVTQARFPALIHVSWMAEHVPRSIASVCLDAFVKTAVR